MPWYRAILGTGATYWAKYTLCNDDSADADAGDGTDAGDDADDGADADADAEVSTVFPDQKYLWK